MSLEFRCEDVGVVCGGKVQADTEEDLLKKIAEHAAKAHGVPDLPETLVAYATSVVRKT